MSVSIKTSHEIELMRHAGKLLEQVHNELAKHIRPGISTWELDQIGEKMIRSLGCIPNFLNYEGFPGSFCLCLNDEVVHGIPSKEKIIKEGDLVAYYPPFYQIDGGRGPMVKRVDSLEEGEMKLVSDTALTDEDKFTVASEDILGKVIVF